MELWFPQVWFDGEWYTLGHGYGNRAEATVALEWWKRLVGVTEDGLCKVAPVTLAEPPEVENDIPF